MHAASTALETWEPVGRRVPRDRGTRAGVRVSANAVFVDSIEELRRQAVEETARLRRHNADLAQLLQEANSREQQSFAEHSRLRQLLQEMHSAFESLQCQSKVCLSRSPGSAPPRRAFLAVTSEAP